MGGDFPAAHSMDTTWFALDRCGHVGVFHSGEEGAVAEGAPPVDEPFDAKSLRAGELAWAIEKGILRPGRHETAVTVHEEQMVPDGRVRSWGPVEGKGIVVHSAYGFFLCGAGATREAVLERNGTGRQSRSPGHYDLEFGVNDGRAWVRGVMTSLAWNWLHARADLCLACVQGGPVGLDERCQIHGVFTYHCSDYGNPPYQRGEPPSAPILLDELNRRFEGRLPGAIPRFEKFCFGEKPVLQPIQWLPTRSYDYDDWLREDGQSVHREGPEDFPAAHSSR